MKRVENQPLFVWNKKRATSMLLLGLSLLLLVFIINMIFKVVYLSSKAEELTKTLESLIAENDRIQGNVLNNEDMTITVYDNYMTDGETVYTFASK